MAESLDDVIAAMRRESEALAEKGAEEAARRMADAADKAAADLAGRQGYYTAADYQTVYAAYRDRLTAAAVEEAMPSLPALALRFLPRLALAMGSNAPSPLVLAAVESVAAYYRGVLSGVGTLAEPVVRDALAMAITEPVSVIELTKRIGEGLAGKAAVNVGGQIRTALQLLDQTVINTQAKGLGFDLWLYKGPDDAATRPFCDAMANKVFTVKALQESDNGQMPNVQYSRGGHNCRHRLQPISRILAQGLGLTIVSPYEMHTESVGKRSITYPVKSG